MSLAQIGCEISSSLAKERVSLNRDQSGLNLTPCVLRTLVSCGNTYEDSPTLAQKKSGLRGRSNVHNNYELIFSTPLLGGYRKTIQFQVPANLGQVSNQV